MPDYAEHELVTVPYVRIVDRTDLETYFDMSRDQPVWLPNSEIQEVREFDQTLRIPEWLAKEKELI